MVATAEDPVWGSPPTPTLMATGFRTNGNSLTPSVLLPVMAGNVQKVPGT